MWELRSEKDEESREMGRVKLTSLPKERMVQRPRKWDRVGPGTSGRLRGRQRGCPADMGGVTPGA